MAGMYNSEIVKREETFKGVRIILSQLIKWEDEATTDCIYFEDEVIKDFLEKFFSKKVHLLIATKDRRYSVDKSKVRDMYVGMRCDTYCSLGTGGAYAEGLLWGGVEIKDIFDIVHDLDPMTSKICTIFNLSDLDDWSEMT
jgi:hypothetical protein